MISFLLVLSLRQLSSSPPLSRATSDIAYQLFNFIIYDSLLSQSVSYICHYGGCKMSVLQSQARGESRLNWNTCKYSVFRKKEGEK